MRHPSAARLASCLLLSIGVVLLAAPGCSKPEPPPPAGSPAARPASAGPWARPRVGEPASTDGDEMAGVRYLEHMTGGARPDERVPMIVALQAMGGDPVRSVRHCGIRASRETTSAAESGMD